MKLPVRIFLIPALFATVISIIFVFSLTERNERTHAGVRHAYDFDRMMDRENHLIQTVAVLSGEIGSRGYRQTVRLNTAADYITSRLEQYGYEPSLHAYEFQGQSYRNISVEIAGSTSPEEIIIVGAHYDTVTGTPGADDNASGIAGLLELARHCRGRSFKRSVRLVFFTLEEPPLFRSKHMGSYVYAQRLKEKGENIRGMICLEMIGYFTNEPESQLYPLPFFRWFYPDRGNFIALVSNLRSRHFLNRVKAAFQKGTDLPVESLVAPFLVPGIDFSDHRSFWHFGYDAIMVTDTAFYRNPNYHGTGDVPQTLDYKQMARVVAGLTSVLKSLAGE